MQGLTSFEQIAIWCVLGVAFLGLWYAVFLRKQIMREDAGTPKMKEVWTAIKDGADAYLSRQLRSILPLIGVLTFALFFSVYIVPPSPEALERFSDKSPDQVRMIIGLARAAAFIMGAFFQPVGGSDRHADGGSSQRARGLCGSPFFRRRSANRLSSGNRDGNVDRRLGSAWGNGHFYLLGESRS
jgi:hypothetical protein